MFNKLPIGIAALTLFAADGNYHIKGVSAIKLERNHHKKHHKKSWPNNSEPPKMSNPGEGKSVDIPNSMQGPFAKTSNA